MHENIETQSIFFINTLAKVEDEIVQLLPMIDDMCPPSEFLGMAGEIENRLKRIDGNLSALRAAGISLFTEYRNGEKAYKAQYNGLVNKINERKATGAQLNIMAELYDGEHFLKSLGVDPNEPAEWTNPSDYSVLKIVDHMHKFMALVNESHLKEVELHSRMNYTNTVLDACLEVTKRLRAVLNDVSFASTMATDVSNIETKRYIALFGNSVGAIRLRIRSLKTMITTTFQMYLAMNNNFEIYTKAVDLLTSIALESMLNPYTNWEIM